MYQGKNELYQDLIETLSISDEKLISNISVWIKDLKHKYINDSIQGSNFKVFIKKSISALLYILTNKINPLTIKERTCLISKVFDNDLSYLFIYGSFYPLDFSDICIKHSLFDEFEQFNKSIFPNTEKIIFSDTEFKNITYHKKSDLNTNNFKNCLFNNTNIKELIESKSENIKKKKENIMKDLKAITKFIDDNQKSLNYIKMHTGITYSKGQSTLYIEILLKTQYLEEILHKGNKEYKIHQNFKPYIEDIKLGSFNNSDVEKLIDLLLLNL